MAAIDKTYAPNWEAYNKLIDWAKDKVIKFETGDVKIIDYISQYDEKEFYNGCRVMNSPVWLDRYLVEHCPIQFVQDRMKEVYDEELIELPFSLKLPEDYKKKRGIKITRTGAIPLSNKGCNKHGKWWLQQYNGWKFDSENKVWINRDLLFPYDTDTSHHKSIKALIRFLKKQKLPKGLEFTLIGRYQGETFKVKIR